MHKLGVCADRDDLGAFLPELVLQLCQSRELRSSDEGKVSGIEKKDCPFLPSLQTAKAHVSKIAFLRLKGFDPEIRYGFTDPNSATLFCHDRSSFFSSYHARPPLQRPVSEASARQWQRQKAHPCAKPVQKPARPQSVNRGLSPEKSVSAENATSLFFIEPEIHFEAAGRTGDEFRHSRTFQAITIPSILCCFHFFLLFLRTGKSAIASSDDTPRSRHFGQTP
jgi:hypothetical protein